MKLKNNNFQLDAVRDSFRVIPSIVIGSAVTGALSMLFGAHLLVPHGGIFVLLIPNAVPNCCFTS